MFGDLHDAISLLFGRRWPKAEGVITSMGAKSVGEGYVLIVEYKFCVGEDGPYTGELECPLAAVGDMTEYNERLRVGEPITIQYRPDDPGVNKADSSIWENQNGL